MCSKTKIQKLLKCLFENIGKIIYELSSNKLNTNIDMNDILREKVDWLYNVLITVVCIFLVNIHKNVHIHRKTLLFTRSSSQGGTPALHPVMLLSMFLHSRGRVQGKWGGSTHFTANDYSQNCIPLGCSQETTFEVDSASGMSMLVRYSPVSQTLGATGQ